MDKNLLIYAVPCFLLLMALEAVLAWRQRRGMFQLADTAGSLGMGIGAVLISLTTGGLMLGFHYWVFQYRLIDMDGSGWNLLLLVVLIDLGFYIQHRCSHRVRLLWTIHVNHHSSQHLNLGTALRQPWLGFLLRAPFYWPIVLLGFDPLLLTSVGTINTILGFWVHTEQIHKLPAPLEYIFNTPSHHRVHHGSNEAYLDSNYGNLFILWDRMLGTFSPEHEAVRYGLTRNIESHNPLVIAFHDLASMVRHLGRARGLRHKLGVLLRPPAESATLAQTDAALGRESVSGT